MPHMVLLLADRAHTHRHTHSTRRFFDDEEQRENCWLSFRNVYVSFLKNRTKRARSATRNVHMITAKRTLVREESIISCGWCRSVDCNDKVVVAIKIL
jgi:hypothetical protein